MSLLVTFTSAAKAAYPHALEHRKSQKKGETHAIAGIVVVVVVVYVPLWSTITLI